MKAAPARFPRPPNRCGHAHGHLITYLRRVSTRRRGSSRLNPRACTAGLRGTGGTAAERRALASWPERTADMTDTGMVSSQVDLRDGGAQPEKSG